MKNKKYFILMFQYNYIFLFGEINGKIEKINFANGKDKLSNCVTFSYDKEDLQFLPDGDPFDVNSNSSFSDFLDFGGYHFDSSNAILEISESIVKSKLIPGLAKGDEIMMLLNFSYYERNENQTETNNDEPSNNKVITLCGHKVFLFSLDDAIDISLELMRVELGPQISILLADQFCAFLMNLEESSVSLLRVPTFEKTAVETVRAKYPIDLKLPDILLRNIKNRILMAKLFNLPIPKTAVYRNQIVNISHSQISDRFDEIMEEVAAHATDSFEDTINGDTFVFDVGMHKLIRESLFKLFKNPVIIREKELSALFCYLIRNLIIEHETITDLQFRAFIKPFYKELKENEDVLVKAGTQLFKLHSIVKAYYRHLDKNNPFKNKETDYFKKVLNDAKKANEK